MTTFDPHRNFIYSTVGTAPSPASSGTTVTVQTGTGSTFPDPASVGAYNVVVCSAATATAAEVCRVTARSGDLLTWTRAQESSSSRSVSVGDAIFMAMTAKSFTDIETAVNAVSAEIVSGTIGTDTNVIGTSFQTILTFSAASFLAQKHYLEVAIPNLRHSVANSQVFIQLAESGVTVGTSFAIDMNTTAGNGVPTFLRERFTPSAASHTYQVQLRNTSAGTATIRTSSLVPAEFRIVQA